MTIFGLVRFWAVPLLLAFPAILHADDIAPPLTLAPSACYQTTNTLASNSLEKRSSLIRQELLLANSPNVLIVAHRGDWRNAPENSLQAISNCIDMGVDIVEIDIAKSKDNQLVLMHDKTLDRTTTGSGYVSDLTLQELKDLHLKNGQDIPTRHQIPTLEEALLVAKNNILVNLDKAYYLMPEVIQIAKKTETLDHIIIKGKVPYKTVVIDLKEHLDKLLFMPIVNLDDQNSNEIINSYLDQMTPVAFEFVFEHEPIEVQQKFLELRNQGSRVWINSLWPFFNAGHDDDLAVHDKEGSYGWLVRNGANIIQTDRPQLLLEYLQSKGLHR